MPEPVRRNRKLTDEQIRQLVERGLTANEIAEKGGMSVGPVYQRCKKLGITPKAAPRGRKPGVRSLEGESFLLERLKHETVTARCALCAWREPDVPALDAHAAFRAHPCSARMAA